jgi:hypothetical protein
VFGSNTLFFLLRRFRGVVLLLDIDIGKLLSLPSSSFVNATVAVAISVFQRSLSASCLLKLILFIVLLVALVISRAAMLVFLVFVVSVGTELLIGILPIFLRAVLLVPSEHFLKLLCLLEGLMMED